MSKAAAFAHTSANSMQAKMDFPALRIAGPAIENYVRHLVWPKLSPGQFLQALNEGFHDPFRLLLRAHYDQFDSAHVSIPPDLRKDFWQPAFYVSARGTLASAVRWGDQYVLVRPVFVLGTIDLSDTRLRHIIAEMVNAKPVRGAISARELFQIADRLTEQADREKAS